MLQKLHRYQDAKRTREYLQRQMELKTRQAHEQKALALRLKIQTQAVEQKAQSLEKIDRREMSALMRDLKRDRRVRDRGEDGLMPSLVSIAGAGKASEKSPAPDLMAEFAKAQREPAQEIPDLMAAFERASKDRAIGEKESGSDRGLGNRRYIHGGQRDNADTDHDRGRSR